MGVNMGMFYKRRDYSTIVNGKNPIVAHEFLGEHLDGKDAIIIDDMISSGESMLDVAKQLKSRNAKRIFAVMGLAVKCGQEITLKTDGENEEEAMNKLSAFLEENL